MATLDAKMDRADSQVLQGVTSENSALGSAMKRGFSTALDYSLRAAPAATNRIASRSHT